MKILILGPLDYVSAKQDLALLNYRQNVYSIYYLIEILRQGEVSDTSLTLLSLILAKETEDKEYNSSNIFFGLMPNKYHFDEVVVYNYDVLSAQEAMLRTYKSTILEDLYTSDDATIRVDNIAEAIKIVESKTARSS